MSSLFGLLMIRGITFGTPVLYFVLGGLLLIGLAFVVYRQTLPPTTVVRRRLLAILRALALVTILFLLFEPVLGWIDQREDRAKVLLLVDRSASIALADQGVVRDSMVNEFLSRSELRTLTESNQLRVYAFGDTVVPTTLDSVRLIAPAFVGTDPASAWAAAVSESSGEDIGAIIVVTDGAQNTGPSPERASSVSDIPIFTVGVGDTTQHRDALIAELFTNDIAYEGSTVPVKVRVRGNSVSGQRSRLRIVDSKSRTLLDQEVSFQGATYEQSFDAQFLADKSGDFRIRAILDSVSGELTLDNNQRSRVIRVLDSRFKVVVLAGSPSADVTFTLQSLGLDTTLAIIPLVESKTGFVGGGKSTEESIADADAFVLINYPTAGSNAAVWDAVAKRITDQGIPFLFHHGPSVSLGRLNRIAARLPVEFQPQAAFDKVLLRSGSSHSAINARGDLRANWTDLPPVLGAIGRTTSKPFAVVVANFVPESTPELSGGPAVVLADVNRRRSAAIAVYETFRWQLGLAKNERGRQFYADLLSRISSWLLAPTDEQRIKITADKKIYSEGETVRFQGQVYGEDLAPTNDATVLVEITSGERKERVSLVGRGNGLYEGEFVPWETGDYNFSGVAIAAEDTLGKDGGTFVVEAFNLEWIESRSRFDVLQTVARNSGGVFVTASQPDSLFSRLRLQERIIENVREIPLWNRPLLLWILIGFLAIEWLLRKRSGML
ncbi:hypothetical protein KJZ99_00790 [bacterium]|nr:hypothetical protein [bacterium]